MNEKLTIIIPSRETEDQKLTLQSLSLQSFQKFKIIVSYDNNKGSNYARNQGFVNYCDTEYVLFSDNDIIYNKNALQTMINLLEKTKGTNVSYAYGWYLRGDEVCGKKEFNETNLKKQNYINTMSIIRSSDFPGFDEQLGRLQDWDLWLNLLINHKRIGVYSNSMIFTTPIRNGITHGGKVTYTEAYNYVKRKYKI